MAVARGEKTRSDAAAPPSPGCREDEPICGARRHGRGGGAAARQRAERAATAMDFGVADDCRHVEVGLERLAQVRRGRGQPNYSWV
jgi:hypothetical protein